MYLRWIFFGLYLIFVIAVIFRVGRLIHGVGEVYLKFFFEQEQNTSRINDLLLVGYYLLNIGYAIYVLTVGQEELLNLRAGVGWLTRKVGFILLVLGGLHVNNMAMIYVAHKMKQNKV